MREVAIVAVKVVVEARVQGKVKAAWVLVVAVVEGSRGEGCRGGSNTRVLDSIVVKVATPLW